MKLKKGIMIHDTPDGTVAVATGAAAKSFNGMLRLSGTAAFILRQMEKETDEEAVCAAVMKKYQADGETVRRDVHAIVCRLSEAGLLD